MPNSHKNFVLYNLKCIPFKYISWIWAKVPATAQLLSHAHTHVHTYLHTHIQFILLLCGQQFFNEMELIFDGVFLDVPILAVSIDLQSVHSKRHLINDWRHKICTWIGSYVNLFLFWHEQLYRSKSIELKKKHYNKISTQSHLTLANYLCCSPPAS